MTSLYLLIPLSLVFLGVVIAALVWAVGSGQYDDLERQGQSILFDDDLESGRSTPSPDATSSAREFEQAGGSGTPKPNEDKTPEELPRDR